MEFHHHYHVDVKVTFSQDNNTSGLILQSLQSLTNKIDKVMAKIDDINALISGINEDTNNIAADLERIAGGITGGLTSEEADGVIAQLTAAAAKLKAVADTNPEPTADETGVTEQPTV
jgi:methyl-accepting chemotaxis protein